MSPAKRAIDEGDPSFMALPTRLRRRIDRAFDSVASSTPSPKRPRPDEAPAIFIINESEPGPSRSAEYEAGGFIVEDLPSSSRASPSASAHIHLSEVPRALGLLDLTPDDDVMAVFKNAGTGWGAQSTHSGGVSRKDWRAVCTALLEGDHGDEFGEKNLSGGEDVEMGAGADSDPDNDEYRMSDLSSEPEEVPTDEYEEGSSTTNTAKAKKTQNISQKTSSKTSEMTIPEQLTTRQKAECREDFARFFPDVADAELDHRRIMIKDIIRVADLLKEKLKAEEILEMLEVFSMSPDKSMSLEDFERLMILTKMVR
ncbi:hypothetical protein BS17DRAFT_778726 [Gyrodon lividus]|nr:hypothetical protein BS17DRAFT_778726 [Gyrodon lividus]